MKEIINTLHVLAASIGGYIGYFLGGRDGFLYALLTFLVIDYISGVMAAITEKHLSSEIGAKGIFRKVIILIFVGIGHIIDSNIIGEGSGIRTAVIFFYLSNEGISIVENSVRLGLPVPQRLKDILEQLKDGGAKGRI